MPELQKTMTEMAREMERVKLVLKFSLWYNLIQAGLIEEVMSDTMDMLDVRRMNTLSTYRFHWRWLGRGCGGGGRRGGREGHRRCSLRSSHCGRHCSQDRSKRGRGKGLHINSSLIKHGMIWMRNVGGGATDGRYSEQTGGLEIGCRSLGGGMLMRRYTLTAACFLLFEQIQFFDLQSYFSQRT